MENKSEFLSGPYLERTQELDHVEQASMNSTDTKLEEVGGAPTVPQRPPLHQPSSHLGEGIGDSVGGGVRLLSVI